MTGYLRALSFACLMMYVAGIWQSFAADIDYQQQEMVRIMYVHVPCAWMSLLVFGLMGVASIAAIVANSVFYFQD